MARVDLDRGTVNLEDIVDAESDEDVEDVGGVGGTQLIGGFTLLTLFAWIGIFAAILGTLGPATNAGAPPLDWFQATAHPSTNVTYKPAPPVFAAMSVPLPPPVPSLTGSVVVPSPSLNPRYSPLPEGPASAPPPPPTPTADPRAALLAYLKEHQPTPTF